MAEHSASDGVLEAFQELVGEGRGFVETEGFGLDSRILASITLDPLEEPVHYAQMEMVVRIEA